MTRIRRFRIQIGKLFRNDSTWPERLDNLQATGFSDQQACVTLQVERHCRSARTGLIVFAAAGKAMTTMSWPANCLQ